MSDETRLRGPMGMEEARRYASEPGQAEALVENHPSVAASRLRAAGEETLRLLAQTTELRRQLAAQQAGNYARNLALDALGYVWCSGGCETGVRRYGARRPLTEAVVREAVRNTERLVCWWNNSGARALAPVVTFAGPDRWRAGVEGGLSAPSPEEALDDALDRAEAEVVRLRTLRVRRTVPPTDAEVAVHLARGGSWGFSFETEKGLEIVLAFEGSPPHRYWQGHPCRAWWPLDAARLPCAWPDPAGITPESAEGALMRALAAMEGRREAPSDAEAAALRAVGGWWLVLAMGRNVEFTMRAREGEQVTEARQRVADLGVDARWLAFDRLGRVVEVPRVGPEIESQPAPGSQSEASATWFLTLLAPSLPGEDGGWRLRFGGASASPEVLEDALRTNAGDVWDNRFSYAVIERPLGVLALPGDPAVEQRWWRMHCPTGFYDRHVTAEPTTPPPGFVEQAMIGEHLLASVLELQSRPSAEKARLRVRLEGRTQPPSDAEIDAHAAAGGAWLVRQWAPARQCDWTRMFQTPQIVREARDDGGPQRWWATGPTGELGDWPVPPATAGVTDDPSAR